MHDLRCHLETRAVAAAGGTVTAVCESEAVVTEAPDGSALVQTVAVIILSLGLLLLLLLLLQTDLDHCCSHQFDCCMLLSHRLWQTYFRQWAAVVPSLVLLLALLLGFADTVGEIPIFLHLLAAPLFLLFVLFQVLVALLILLTCPRCRILRRTHGFIDCPAVGLGVTRGFVVCPVAGFGGTPGFTD